MKNSIPSGVVQFFEPLSSLRRSTENSLIEFFKDNSYKEIVTPSFSYENGISSGLFEPLKTKLFKLIDKSSGQTMILRADITMQIMQAVLMGDFDMPARICYADNIYRDIKEHSGQKREFKQVGVELLGIKEKTADNEIINLSIESLRKFDIKDITVRISDTYIFERLFEKYGLNDSKKTKKIKGFLEKKNISLILKSITELPNNFIDNLKRLETLSGYVKKNNDYYNDVLDIAQDAIDTAKKIQSDNKDIKVFLDLFYCEHPMYHHGITFSVFSENRSLVVGGRYGNVTKPFGKYIPATGFAINLDELIYFLSNKEKK